MRKKLGLQGWMIKESLKAALKEWKALSALPKYERELLRILCQPRPKANLLTRFLGWGKAPPAMSSPPIS